MSTNLGAIQRLAKVSARNALNAVQYAGRFGGFTELEKDKGEWERLRQSGIENRPTLEEVRTFLTKSKMMTLDHEEILFDYEYYVATKEHLRKDICQRSRRR